MKRIHIHIAVDDLDQSTVFYAALFGQNPTVAKPDYIKWQLDDPRVNLSITHRGTKPAGVDHLGIQVDHEAELAGIHAALSNADIASKNELGANCCYAQSDKHWTLDPQNVIWELFRSHGKTDVYGEDHGPVEAMQNAPSKTAACCA